MNSIKKIIKILLYPTRTSILVLKVKNETQKSFVCYKNELIGKEDKDNKIIIKKERIGKIDLRELFSEYNPIVTFLEDPLDVEIQKTLNQMKELGVSKLNDTIKKMEEDKKELTSLNTESFTYNKELTYHVQEHTKK